jgi:ubiquinone/menaquinone biosynthesis C-methylase UbiE
VSLHVLQKTAPGRALLLWLAAPRARSSVDHFAALLRPGEKLLDVGSGICDITNLLLKKGYDVTPLDVQDFSYLPAIKPTLYDGHTMPFDDQTFDTALILTVLHHTPHPEAVLREAQRVARRIIITEDIYTSTWHKYATFGMDSLLNLEFIGHPHSNKTDQQWRETFARLGLRITAEKSMRSFGVLRHTMYVLETAMQTQES